jgi:hypothetical protein
MRLFRLRFTLRWIMAAVALVALLLGLGRMWVRRASCLHRAKWHSIPEAGFRGESDSFQWEAGLRRKTGDFAEAKELEPRARSTARNRTTRPASSGPTSRSDHTLGYRGPARTEVPPARRPVLMPTGAPSS